MIVSQARELITPTIRTTMSGYGSRTGEFEGINDDLYVKPLYLENNGSSMMFITFDLCHYMYELNEEIMEYAAKKFSMPYENIVVNYSHTHAGSKILSPTEKKSLSPLHDFYISRAKACIDRAFLSKFEGTMQFCKTSGRWNVNRRLETAEGFRLMPNHNGITDDELNMIVIRSLENDIKTILVNYSCHPVTLSATMFLSAEFPGRLCQLLEAEYYGSMAFFLQGAAGNMRPLITANKGKFKPCSFRELDELSSNIANEVKRAVHSKSFELVEPDFKGVKFKIDLPVEPLDKAYFEEKLASAGKYLAKKMQNILDAWDTIEDKATVNCGIIRFTDDLFIPYMGGEIVIEIKEIVQNVFKPAATVFLGYHEALTYIPDDKIIDEGGYEGFDAPLNAGFRGPFKKGINEIIENAFSDALQNL